MDSDLPITENLFRFWLEAGALFSFFVIVMYMVIKLFNSVKNLLTEWVPKIFKSVIDMMSGVTDSSKESSASSKEAVSAIKKLVETDVAMSAIIAEMGRDTRQGFKKIGEASRFYGRALVLLAPDMHKNEVQTLVDQIASILDKDG